MMVLNVSNVVDRGLLHRSYLVRRPQILGAVLALIAIAVQAILPTQAMGAPAGLHRAALCTAAPASKSAPAHHHMAVPCKACLAAALDTGLGPPPPEVLPLCHGVDCRLSPTASRLAGWSADVANQARAPPLSA